MPGIEKKLSHITIDYDRDGHQEHLEAFIELNLCEYDGSRTILIRQPSDLLKAVVDTKGELSLP